MNYMPRTLKFDCEPMVGVLTGPRSETTTIIWLNKQSSKLPPNSYLYSWISEALTHQQISFFVQWIVVNKETHNWSKGRKQVSMECSVRYLHHICAPSLRNHYRREGRKIVRIMSEEQEQSSVFWTWEDHCTYELIDLYKIKPVNITARRGNGVASPIPSWGIYRQ